jgi:ribosomal-protein-alanine N-acetyltransferase
MQSEVSPGESMALLSATGSDEERGILAGRVTLRAPASGDYIAWAALRGASRAFLAPWEPTWPPDDLTRAAFRRRLRRYARESREDASRPFFVFRAEDGALMGSCILSNIRRGVAQAGTLGYWIGQAFAGKGYMTEAVKGMIGYAFDELGLHRIEAACLPSNEPSRRLLTRVGFTEEGYARAYLKINGRWEDHVLFGLLFSDWRG